jgi:hypothetical protein
MTQHADQACRIATDVGKFSAVQTTSTQTPGKLALTGALLHFVRR